MSEPVPPIMVSLSPAVELRISNVSTPDPPVTLSTPDPNLIVKFSV